MSDDALEEDIHPSLSLPDFCPVPVCFNVRERAFRAVDVPQNAININTLKLVDCLREAGAGRSHRDRRSRSTDADKSAKLIWTHEVRPQGEAQKRRVNRGSAAAVPSSQHDQRFQIQINSLKLVDREERRINLLTLTSSSLRHMLRA
jgi:hypothetical protein